MLSSPKALIPESPENHSHQFWGLGLLSKCRCVDFSPDPAIEPSVEVGPPFSSLNFLDYSYGPHSYSEQAPNWFLWAQPLKNASFQLRCSSPTSCWKLVLLCPSVLCLIRNFYVSLLHLRVLRSWDANILCPACAQFSADLNWTKFYEFAWYLSQFVNATSHESRRPWFGFYGGEPLAQNDSNQPHSVVPEHNPVSTSWNHHCPGPWSFWLL